MFLNLYRSILENEYWCELFHFHSVRKFRNVLKTRRWISWELWAPFSGILPDFSIVFSSNKSSIRRLVPTVYCFQTSLRSHTLRVQTTEMFSNQVKFILTQALWSRCSINALGDVRSDGSLHGRGVGALGVEVAHPEGRQLLPREPGAPGLRLSCQMGMIIFIKHQMAQEMAILCIKSMLVGQYVIGSCSSHPACILAHFNAGHPGNVPNLVLQRSRWRN